MLENRTKDERSTLADEVREGDSGGGLARLVCGGDGEGEFAETIAEHDLFGVERVDGDSHLAFKGFAQGVGVARGVAIGVISLAQFGC